VVFDLIPNFNSQIGKNELRDHVREMWSRDGQVQRWERYPCRMLLSRSCAVGN